jgi:hypothetical protein
MDNRRASISARAGRLRVGTNSGRAFSGSRTATRFSGGVSSIGKVLRAANQRANQLARSKGIGLNEASARMRESEGKFRNALDEMQYLEYLKKIKDNELVQDFEQKLAQRAMTLEEQRELKKQMELQRVLQKKLKALGLSELDSVLMSKELSVVLRGFLAQEAITEEAFKKVIENDKILREVSSMVSLRMKDKEIISALRAGHIRRTDVVAEAAQAVLTHHGFIQQGE